MRFVCRLESKYRVVSRLQNQYPHLDIRCVDVRFKTRGAAETLFILLQRMSVHELTRKTLSVDCHTLFRRFVRRQHGAVSSNAFPYPPGTPPRRLHRARSTFVVSVPSALPLEAPSATFAYRATRAPSSLPSYSPALSRRSRPALYRRRRPARCPVSPQTCRFCEVSRPGEVVETSLLHLFRRVKHEKCYLGEAAQLLLHFHGGKPCENAGEVVRPLLRSTSRVLLSLASARCHDLC